ncbi:hypothetical protein SAMN05877753_103208 [Bacillus oleivorans]|uniref:Uncharacterized protein n=1 Tax=Bacillus oleivorans TaxID=1448271 RepID=A0A285CQP3_9BACI|nr:hypothetical protein SAMN05877753_103208 [Bacillus oleivorans]
MDKKKIATNTYQKHISFDEEEVIICQNQIENRKELVLGSIYFRDDYFHNCCIRNYLSKNS